MVSSRAGGLIGFTADASESLIDAGHEVTIFSTNLGPVPSSGEFRKLTPDEMPAAADKLDIELFDVEHPRRLVHSPDLARRLNDVAGEFDLVHVHSLWLHPQYAGARAARRNDVPYVVSPHGALDPALRGRGRARKALTSTLWQNRMLREAGVLHITTEEEGELIADVAPNVPRRVVPNGIWVDRLADPQADGERFRDRHLQGHSGKVILYFGRITFKKGIDILLRAFAQAAPEGTRLAIVGPDDEGLGPQLEALATELGVASATVFTGPLYGRDRADALAAADVWALPSHTENFGIAVVEAMALGCACVVSPAVNLAPAISQAGAGVVAELDPQVFGSAMAELLADEPRRAAVSASAREFAQRYDWSRVAPQLAELYADLLAGRMER